ncbi:hypothetical protein [Mesorhizobium sp. IMUNJ 23232]|uniref:hypothetical protein n=1 Tax=Mesorhizobium sp. IMUNJ 23232 TaxID=3376064 RepID=UPI0037A2C116
MDKTVPPGAAKLLVFIYETETKLSPPDCYDVIFGHRESRLPKRLTSMTLGEVIDAQKNWSSKAWVKTNWGYGSASSASGAAQFMRDTLIDLSKKFFLQGDQPFDCDFQDRMAFELLKRRGYNDFIAGKISRTAFGNRLAMEWASFPVLTAIQGGHRKVGRGETFYAGDGLNKALVAPEKVEAVLDAVKALVDAPEPAAPPTGPIPPDYPVEPPAPQPPAEQPKPAFDLFAWFLSWFRR